MDDEARKAGLTPTADQPAVKVEAFLERHLGAALDQHAKLPIDVLGQTVFEPGLPVRVEINADLTGAIDDGGGLSDIGRWRATLAHEAAHILLHRVLFEVPLTQGKLFEEEPAPSQTLMRCLKRDVAPGRGASDWREVQANRGMAALLMPRRLFSSVAAEERSANELPPFPLVDASQEGDRLVRRLAARFDVSRKLHRSGCEPSDFWRILPPRTWASRPRCSGPVRPEWALRASSRSSTGRRRQPDGRLHLAAYSASAESRQGFGPLPRRSPPGTSRHPAPQPDSLDARGCLGTTGASQPRPPWQRLRTSRGTRRRRGGQACSESSQGSWPPDPGAP